MNNSKKLGDGNSETGDFDKDFRQNAVKAVEELDQYLIEHNLHLVQQGEKLVNKWSYV